MSSSTGRWVAGAPRGCSSRRRRGAPDTYEQVLADMKERDYRDSHREIAPLRPAQDAIVIDSSDQTLEENVQAILSTIRGKLQ